MGGVSPMNTIRSGSMEPILALVTDALGNYLLGQTDLSAAIFRISDQSFLDWIDYTFKGSGWTEKQKAMTEITDPPLGMYQTVIPLDTSLMVNPLENDTYIVYIEKVSLGSAILPDPYAFTIGGWIDNIDKIDQLPTLDPSLAVTGSLLDRLTNKDISKTYNQTTDSLEAIKERIG